MSFQKKRWELKNEKVGVMINRDGAVMRKRLYRQYGKGRYLKCREASRGCGAEET